MATSIQQRLDDFSPAVCRLMARKVKGKTTTLMTDAEIAIKCETLDIFDIVSIQMKTSWKGIPILQALEYMKACGIDLDNAKEMDKHNKYLKRTPSWSHVKRDSAYKTRWLPLLLLQRAYHNVEQA